MELSSAWKLSKSGLWYRNRLSKKKQRKDRKKDRKDIKKKKKWNKNSNQRLGKVDDENLEDLQTKSPKGTRKQDDSSTKNT